MFTFCSIYLSIKSHIILEAVSWKSHTNTYLPIIKYHSKKIWGHWNKIMMKYKTMWLHMCYYDIAFNNWFTTTISSYAHRRLWSCKLFYWMEHKYVLTFSHLSLYYDNFDSQWHCTQPILVCPHFTIYNDNLKFL